VVGYIHRLNSEVLRAEPRLRLSPLRTLGTTWLLPRLLYILSTKCFEHFFGKQLFRCSNLSTRPIHFPARIGLSQVTKSLSKTMSSSRIPDYEIEEPSKRDPTRETCLNSTDNQNGFSKKMDSQSGASSSIVAHTKAKKTGKDSWLASSSPSQNTLRTARV
jgi:hypothetical protein